MDYFSGLKKAFDNIESGEMTRSLVGNNKEEPPVEPYVIEEKDSPLSQMELLGICSLYCSNSKFHIYIM